MATAHLHRLLAIVPEARVAGFNTFFKNNADLDPDGGERTFTMMLNPSGSAANPVTHRWAFMALTNPGIRRVVVRVCQDAGLAFPADWDTRTRAQKRQWFLDNAAAILAAIGCRLFHCDNDGGWTDAAAELTAAGLKKRRA